MSSYPPIPDQPDNPDEIPTSPFKRPLGLADYLFMAMNPHAGQLLSHITQMHNQEVDRAYKRKRDRQADEYHQAQLKRLTDEDAAQRATEADKRKQESFKTEQDVVKQGGSKIKSMEDLFKYDAANTIVSRAPGEAYRVPTERTVATRKQGDKDTAAAAALKAKIAEKEAMMPLNVKEATTKQAALMPGDLKKIGAQAEINAKNRALHIFQSKDDDGNVTFTGVNPTTGRTVSQTSGGKIGTTKTEKAATEGMSARAERAQAKVQAMIDGIGTPKPDDARSNKERAAAATNAVKMAIAAHPGELEGGVDKASGWPWIKRKEGSKAAVTTGAAKAGVPDSTGHTPGDVIQFKGKPHIYRGINPATGKMVLEEQ